MAGYYSNFANNPQGSMWSNQPQQYYNNNNNWNGYNPNPQITMEDVIYQNAFNILKEQYNRGQINEQLANEILNRITASIHEIAMNFNQTLPNNNGQFNTSDVYYRLRDSVIPQMYNSIVGQRPVYNNGYQQNYGYQQAPMFQQPINNGGVFQNSAQIASSTGQGKILREKAEQSINKHFRNQQFVPTSANNNTIQQNNQQTSSNVTQPKKDILEIIKEKLIKANEAYEKSLNVDKLTSNSTELINNESLLVDKIDDPKVPEISVIEGDSIEDKTINVIRASDTDDPDYCELVDRYDYTCYGEMISTSLQTLKTPVSSCKEAIELVKEAHPGITETVNWMVRVNYKELVVKKLPQYAEEAKKAFKEIGASLDKLSTLNDINNIIVPIINTQRQEVQEYLTALAMDRINKIFKAMLYIPKCPNQYIHIGQWKHIFDITDKNNAKDNNFIAKMFNGYGNDYPTMVFYCVKSAIKDVFWCDEERTVVTTEEKEDIGLLARCSDITTTVGKYRISDYGWMPENYKNELFNNVNKNYIVHKYYQDVIATNIDVQKVLGSTSRYTYIRASLNVQQYALLGLLTKLATRTKYDKREINLVQFSQDGSTIVGNYIVSLTEKEGVLIIRK